MSALPIVEQLPPCPVADLTIELVVDTVDELEPATVSEVSDATGLSLAHVSTALTWLEMQGSVIRVGAETATGGRSAVLWGLG